MAGSAHCDSAVLRGREDVGAAAVGEVAVRTHCSEIVAIWATAGSLQFAPVVSLSSSVTQSGPFIMAR